MIQYHLKILKYLRKKKERKNQLEIGIYMLILSFWITTEVYWMPVLWLFGPLFLIVKRYFFSINFIFTYFFFKKLKFLFIKFWKVEK